MLLCVTARHSFSFRASAAPGGACQLGFPKQQAQSVAQAECGVGVAGSTFPGGEGAGRPRPAARRPAALPTDLPLVLRLIPGPEGKDGFGLQCWRRIL